MASQNELVDLSLFSVSPTGDGEFPPPDSPESTSPQIRITSWEDIPPTYHPCIVREKPLPPLPNESFPPAIYEPFPTSSGGFRPPQLDQWPVANEWIQPPEGHYLDPKPIKKRTGGFLSMIKRSKSDVSHDQKQKVKKNSTGPPRLTLSVPQQAARTVPSSPLLWVPDAQVWMVHDQHTSQHPTACQSRDSCCQHGPSSTAQRTMPRFMTTEDDADISPPPSYSLHDHWQSDPRTPSESSRWGVVATRMNRPASTGH
ncbi:hypothetical protein MMC16_005702 [Acarospora aff. strigata]|nr:hypothetical protein [Acarospora aff. strigata]